MSEARPRLDAVDRLRGLVVVLMALDHARHFFAPHGFSAEDPATATWPWFLTRLPTHLCAPIFVLLAGASAEFVAARGAAVRAGGAGVSDGPAGADDGQAASSRARHLALRGLLLMALEVTWVNVSWFGGFQPIHLGVLWGIGGAMVLLALVVRLGPRGAGAVGLSLTSLLTMAPVGGDVWFAPLFRPSFWQGGGVQISNVYAIVPWFAVMAMGYGAGPWFRAGSPRAGWAGAALLVGFVLLRALGLGDPSPYTPHPRGPAISALVFLSPSKYPPSLMFLAMTLGAGALLLTAVTKMRGPAMGALAVFGRAPLAFYLLHLPLLHLAALPFLPIETPSLPAVLVAWTGATIVLLPVCAAYGRAKAARRYGFMRWV